MGGAVTVTTGFEDVHTQDVLFENVTIANNYTTKMGGAFAIYMNGKVTLRNSIVWNNTADKNGKVIDMGNDNHGITYTDSLIIEYSDIDTTQENWLGHGDVNGTLVWSEGNIVADPLFNDTFNNDYTLKETFPFIDAGNPDLLFCDIADHSNNETTKYPATIIKVFDVIGNEFAALVNEKKSPRRI